MLVNPLPKRLVEPFMVRPGDDLPKFGGMEFDRSFQFFIDGMGKKHEAWTSWGIQNNFRFASLHHVYDIVENATTSSLDSLREIMKVYSLVTNTILPYVEESSTIHINHWNGSLAASVKVPGLGEIKIEHLLEEENGILYLQKLFNTDDSGEKIMGNLELLSDKSRKDINIWTGSKGFKFCAAGFNLGASFHLTVFSYDDYPINLIIGMKNNT